MSRYDYCFVLLLEGLGYYLLWVVCLFVYFIVYFTFVVVAHFECFVGLCYCIVCLLRVCLFNLDSWFRVWYCHLRLIAVLLSCVWNIEFADWFAGLVLVVCLIWLFELLVCLLLVGCFCLRLFWGVWYLF